MKEYLRFVSLCLGHGLNGIIWNCIPIIFYRPKFQCKDLETDTEYLCEEVEACSKLNNLQNPGDLIQVSEYSQIYSISMEFNLFCEQKIIETNILALGILFSLFGAIFGILVHFPLRIMQKVFWVILFCNLIIFVSANFVTSVYQVAILYSLWSALAFYFPCVSYVYITQSFKGSLKQYGVTYCNIIWCFASILYVFVTIKFGNWRDNIGIFLTLFTLVILLVQLFARNKEELVIQENIQQNQQQNQEQQEQEVQQSLGQMISKIVSDFRYRIWVFKQNQVLRRNSYIWCLCFTVVNICVFISIIVLNKFIGNLYVNSLGSTTLELLAQSVSALIIFKKFNIKHSLMVIYLVMAIIYTMSFFISYQNTLDQQNLSILLISIKLMPLVVGKLTHDMLWTLLYTYLDEICPQEHQQFVNSNSQLIGLIATLVMPYYKYLVEIYEINYFILLQIVCIVTVYYTYQFKSIQNVKIQDKNEKEKPLIELF